MFKVQGFKVPNRDRYRNRYRDRISSEYRVRSKACSFHPEPVEGQNGSPTGPFRVQGSKSLSGSKSQNKSSHFFPSPRPGARWNRILCLPRNFPPKKSPPSPRGENLLVLFAPQPELCNGRIIFSPSHAGDRIRYQGLSQIDCCCLWRVLQNHTGCPYQV